MEIVKYKHSFHKCLLSSYQVHGTALGLWRRSGEKTFYLQGAYTLQPGEEEFKYSITYVTYEATPKTCGKNGMQSYFGTIFFKSMLSLTVICITMKVLKIPLKYLNFKNVCTGSGV